MTIKHYPLIGFIGAGNMASCLINGLIANHYPPQQIWASHPRQERLAYLHQQFNIQTESSNKKIIEHAQVIVLCVKPQIMSSVINELREVIAQYHPLLISVAASISEKDLLAYLGYETAIVRAMPNVAAFVGSGATGMYANAHVTPVQRDLAESIMRAVGITLWVKEEKLINAITALSGCGPAYFFVIMEALKQAAVDLGLSAEDAHLLILQTALGAARLGLSTNDSLTDLCARVASKGGSTERALKVLEERDIKATFAAALRAAYTRASE